MNILRIPDERFANLPDFPFASHYREIPDGDGAGHFLQEDKGEELAGVIARFIEANP